MVSGRPDQCLHSVGHGDCAEDSALHTLAQQVADALENLGERALRCLGGGQRLALEVVVLEQAAQQ